MSTTPYDKPVGYWRKRCVAVEERERVLRENQKDAREIAQALAEDMAKEPRAAAAVEILDAVVALLADQEPRG